MHKRLLFLFCLAVVFASGCKTTSPVAEMQLADAPVSFSVIADSLEADPEIEAMVSPYRQRLAEAINEEIGQAAGLLEKSSPESALGNMAADAMLFSANKIASSPVDLAVTNNGGLRVSIAPGPITVGEIYELMPFENLMVVLELSGMQVDSLAQEIAANDGEPIAGFSFMIDQETSKATNVQVNNNPLDRDRTYRLVTSDYLANGGGGMTTLWRPINREDLNMLLRDAFIEYIRTTGTIHSDIDGRIKLSNQ